MDVFDLAKNALGGGTAGGDQTGALVSGLIGMLTGSAGSDAPAGSSAPPGLGSLIGALGSAGTTSTSGGGASGLKALIGMFASKGLGDIVNSWVSTGQNLPISADQLQNALGRDRVAQLASSAGLPPEAALSQLTTLLPTVVDKLTPNGTVSQEGLFEQGLNLLKAFKS